jgi:hypothetical protein
MTPPYSFPTAGTESDRPAIRRSGVKKKRLGDVLVERGTIQQADIDQALAAQQEKNARLGEVLIQNLQVQKRNRRCY